ncbi:MAG: hypothetical protein ACLPR9_01085 [Acidimicrobiales bacterium]
MPKIPIRNTRLSGFAPSDNENKVAVTTRWGNNDTTSSVKVTAPAGAAKTVTMSP